MGLLLVAVVLVAILTLAVSALSARAIWTVAPVVGVALVVVLAGLAVGVRGVGGEDDGDEASTAERPSVPTTAPPDERQVRPPDVRIDARGGQQFHVPVTAIEELGDGEVRLVEIRTGAGLVTGLARQCRGAPRTCEPAVPVQTDESGRARFLFEFHACTRCVLDIEVADVPIVVPLVFGGRAPAPGRVTVAGGALRHGGRVTVQATGFPAGATGVVTECVPPGPADPRACGGPAARVPIRFGPSGAARVDYPVHVGRVGRSAGSCRRGEPCAIAVILDDAVGADGLVVVALAGSPGPAYAGARLLLGLGVAGLLLVVAVVLARRTDWRPIGLPSQLEP